MYNAVSVARDTWWTGVNDYETDLFESLWRLPNGVAYNAYVVGGEGGKTVAIDTVKGPWSDEYMMKLDQALAGRGLDMLVVNHMEPDHAGLIAQMMRRWPELRIIANDKTVPMLERYHGVSRDRIHIVKDGETLDIGGGHVLQFFMIPMIHWPESMVTFDTSTGVLFSNDAFGGFGAHEGGLFDDETFRDRWESEMLRYYASIVAKYSALVQGALKKLGGLPIKNIFPSHGTLFRSDPAQAVALYDKWSRCEPEEGAVVIYGSMYGNTRRMAEAVCTGLKEGGIKRVHLYDASRAGASFMLRDIWRFKGLALLSCTYNGLLFPPIESICSKLINRMPKNRVLGIAGSYSWSKGAALNALADFAKKMNFEMPGPDVDVAMSPDAGDLEKCAELGRSIAKAVKGC